MKLMMTILFFSQMLFSQNFESHLWENRVLIISGNKSNTLKIEQQFNQFKEKAKSLLERKLVVYKCIENSCMFYNWIDSPKKIKISTNNSDFNLKLIGLDGNKKFNTKDVKKAEVIFDRIDRMPMRQTEIRNKKITNKEKEN